MRTMCACVLSGFTLVMSSACAGRQPQPESSGAAQAGLQSARVVSDVQAPDYQLTAEQSSVDGEASAQISIHIALAEQRPLKGIKVGKPFEARAADGSPMSVVLNRDLMGYEMADGFLFPDEFDGMAYMSLVSPNSDASRSFSSLEGELTLRMAAEPRDLYVPLKNRNLHTHKRGLLPSRSGSFTSEDGQTVTYRWILWSESMCPEGTRLDHGSCLPLEAGAGPDGTRQYSFEVVPSRDASLVFGGLELVNADGQIVQELRGPGDGNYAINFYGDPAEDPFDGYSIRVRYFTGIQDVALPIQETDVPIMFHDGRDVLPSPEPVEPRAGEQMHVVYVAVFTPEETDAVWDEHMPKVQSNSWPVSYGELNCTYPDNPDELSGFDPDNIDLMTLAFFFNSASDAERFAEAHFSAVAGIGTSSPSCLD